MGLYSPLMNLLISLLSNIFPLGFAHIVEAFGCVNVFGTISFTSCLSKIVYPLGSTRFPTRGTRVFERNKIETITSIIMMNHATMNNMREMLGEDHDRCHCD